MIAQILFTIMLAAAVFVFARNIGFIKKLILLGKDERLETDRPTRMRNLLLLAFGQKKMFRYPLVAVMHFIIYAGFIIINVEILEIILDGIFGTHRLFAPYLGSFYTFLINFFEILALGVLLVCVVFLIRRNIVKLPRFQSNDLDGWPRKDGNYILIAEILLMSLFLTMNATDQLLQQRGVEHYAAHETGPFAVSRFIMPWFSGLNTPALVMIERLAWWLHIGGILAFLNYLPYSKHDMQVFAIGQII